MTAEMSLQELDAFIAGGTRALGLPLDDAWLPVVRLHMQITFRLGALVTQFPLPDEAEPAPVFEA
jgi:Protein of unknown function (DUF4089)